MRRGACGARSAGGVPPQDHGYLGCRWSSELQVVLLQRQSGIELHTTKVYQCLKRLGLEYRRARLTLCICDPKKSQRMRAIARALADEGAHTEVFFCDESDVGLNPRIGLAWTANRAGNPGTVHNRKFSNPGSQGTSFGNLT